MADQRERLNAILDGFLVSDIEAIKEKSDELNGAMRAVIQIYPPSGEKENAVWQATADIVNESFLLKQETEKNDFNKAFVHFNRISSQCIRCHQATREWGKLPEPPPQAKEKTLPAENADQKEPA